MQLRKIAKTHKVINSIALLALLILTSSCSRVKDVKLITNLNELNSLYTFEGERYASFDKSTVVLDFKCKIRWSWKSPDGYFSWKESGMFIFIENINGDNVNPICSGGLGHWFAWEKKSSRYPSLGTVSVDQDKKIITVNFIENIIDIDGARTGKQGPSPINGRYRFKGQLATIAELTSR